MRACRYYVSFCMCVNVCVHVVIMCLSVCANNCLQCSSCVKCGCPISISVAKFHLIAAVYSKKYFSHQRLMTNCGCRRSFSHGNLPYSRIWLQGSASECVLVSVLAARHAVLRDLKTKYPDSEDGHILSKLVAYCSKLVRMSAASRSVPFSIGYI